MKRSYKDQSGITGLETAIILIAFVVVAAVFAYTVLSAGLFSTQRSQEAVYSSLEKTQSTLELAGTVITQDQDNNDYVDQIDIPVKLALQGEPVDFTPNSGATAGTHKVVISYQDENQWKKDLEWSLTKLGSADSDNLLETNETFQLTIANLESGTTNGLNPDLAQRTTFNILLRSPNGAALQIERKTPKSIDQVMNLN
ncbi:MAG: hypothetical protein FJZ95_00670 [Chloroflexi bacterium]|nr:hypothetical protein [Chloroflexota bacterium]